MTTKFSDYQIVNGLSKNDSAVIDYLYKEVGPVVKRIIQNMGGRAEDADDIFQEGIIAAFVNIKSGKYTLEESTKFSSYLTQICKYKWYDRTKSANETRNVPITIDFEDNADIVSTMETEEKYNKLQSVIGELGANCQEILKRFYWKQESMEEIGEALNMQTKSAKNSKYRCMEQLRKLINEKNLNFTG